MKIFKVERPYNYSYDDYDSFICYANSESEARSMSPSEFYTHKEDGWYFNYSDGSSKKTENDSWVEDLSTLTVSELHPEFVEKPEVILASFNAG